MAYIVSNKLYFMALLAQLLIIFELNCFKSDEKDLNSCNQTSCVIQDTKKYTISKTFIDTLYNPIDGLYVYKTN